MTQDMILGQRLVLVARRHFACFWVLPPQRNKNQFKLLDLQGFVLVTKLHRNTTIISTDIASMFSGDKELPLVYISSTMTCHKMISKVALSERKLFGIGEFKTGGKCILPSSLPLYKLQPRAFFYNIETH